MKFTSETAALKRACDTAKRAVSGKSSIPALEGLLVRACGFCEKNPECTGTIEITGYDLEVGIQARVDAVVWTPGEWVIDAALLCGILGKIADKSVTIEVDQRSRVIISGGEAKYNLAAMPAKDFPGLPAADDAQQFIIHTEVLQGMIRGTVFAVSTLQEAKPVHTGVLFEYAEGALTLAAIDGFRLATRNTVSAHTGERVRFVVPAKALREIAGLKVDVNTDVYLSRRHITFDIGGVRIASRLLDGEFMNYRAAIPQDFETEIQVRKDDLLAAIGRVSLIITEKIKSPIIMELCPKDGSIVLSCKTGTGEAQERVSVQGCNSAKKIGFNHRYLADALSACDDDTVTLCINGAAAPVIIVPPKGKAYMHMVLPVRLDRENGGNGYAA